MTYQAARQAVGIDLGTTNSAVATISRAGRTIMLLNELGEVLTPSVVRFEQDEVIVGREACKAVGYDLAGVAAGAKRDIGQPYFARPIHGKSLPPEVIEACVLKHLRQSITAQVAQPPAVVITVPAFFDERRRKATADAAQMAGLDLLDIVNEPTAAALAFGELLGYLSETGSARQTLRLLAFDLGGGTFDVTVIELHPDRFVTLATDGDVRLGGLDWDARLADYVAQKFEAACRVDPREDVVARAKILRLAEDAKHTLSARTRAVVRVDHAGHSAEITVTRPQFEALTADLLERTAHTTSEVLAAAGLNWKQIDRLLLVGGSTRMPMVGRKLYELSGLAADQSVNPDEAVARGAAIYAAYLLSQQERGEQFLRFRIVDVNSHSLGVEGFDLATGRKTNSILIPRNSPLPAQVTQRFVTKRPHQQSIVLHVLEGEHSQPADCIPIGRAVLRNLPPDLPQGHPLDVTYTYASNGRLTVQLQVVDTDRQLTMELQRGDSLTPEHVHRWSRVVDSADGFRRFAAMLEKVLGVEPES